MLPGVSPRGHLNGLTPAVFFFPSLFLCDLLLLKVAHTLVCDAHTLGFGVGEGSLIFDCRACFCVLWGGIHLAFHLVLLVPPCAKCQECRWGVPPS